MVQGYKVKLKPNNKQKKKLIECFGIARFAYNWALDYQIKNYEQGNKYISESNLRKIFTQFNLTGKKSPTSIGGSSSHSINKYRGVKFMKNKNIHVNQIKEGYVFSDGQVVKRVYGYSVSDNLIIFLNTKKSSKMESWSQSTKRVTSTYY